MADKKKPNVAGMIADPEFRGLAPSDQREALRMLTSDEDFAGLSDAETMQFVSKIGGMTPPQVPKPNINMPMQQSNLGIALGSGNNGVANPQQPAEQFALQNPEQQGKLATASAIGAAGTLGVAAGPAVVNAGARALTPYVIKAGEWAAMHPVIRTMLTEAAKKFAGGTALAAGYKYGKKFLDASSQ